MDLLSGPAIARISESQLEEVVFTDTIPLSGSAKTCTKVRAVGTDRLFGEAIKRIYQAESLSSLFV